MPSKVVIIGAAGAVGKRLARALNKAGMHVIASDRMDHMPSSIKNHASVCVGGVDVRDEASVTKLFTDHCDADTAVWNLASPLSVETAMSPEVAEAVTIGGMKNTIAGMRAVGARRICFTDSIGSFGASSPRTNCSARWLIDNPDQDPGSDYGRQKRAVRDLIHEFETTHNGDPRVAVLPGVLHSNSVWGNGTTEYALDALLAAPHQATRLGLPTGEAYVCPVDPDVRVPMVFVDDLMRGLVALQEADEAQLTEPQRGYCVPGLSFSPHELFAEIRKHHPGFGFRVELDANMNKFAQLWPDELATDEPLRDLGYAPEVGLADMVANVLAAHEQRNESTAEAFKTLDVDSDGILSREDIESHVRKHLVRGREDYAHSGQEAVGAAVDKLMDEMANKDGLISWGTFSEWNRRNTVENVVRNSSREIVINELAQAKHHVRTLELQLAKLESAA